MKRLALILTAILIFSSNGCGKDFADGSINLWMEEMAIYKDKIVCGLLLSENDVNRGELVAWNSRVMPDSNDTTMVMKDLPKDNIFLPTTTFRYTMVAIVDMNETILEDDTYATCIPDDEDLVLVISGNTHEGTMSFGVQPDILKPWVEEKQYHPYLFDELSWYDGE